jgi:hypothetical protein
VSVQQFLLFALAFLEVRSQLGAVLQVIADNLVGVGQLQTGELLGDFLRRGTPIEGANHEIQRDACSADTVHAVGVLRQGNRFDQFGHGHTSIVTLSRGRRKDHAWSGGGPGPRAVPPTGARFGAGVLVAREVIGKEDEL